jgi:NAD(P)-dependent dehydrogenase (short-subunit alcohol dehydrogenase family)
MAHPALTADSVAVITGGASGIGLGAAKLFGATGMAVVLVDNRAELLDNAAEEVREAGARAVVAKAADVSDRAALETLEAEVAEAFGGTDILMNNAGIQPGSTLFGDPEAWQRLMAVNLWGVIHGSQVFGPRMIDRGRPGAIINTGSKQGITTPPGDPAYNTSKAAVKAFTEALAYELRTIKDHHLTAHLLIPGFVFTDLTARGRTEKPDAAWTPDQTAAFMIESLNRGDFYILCPDGDVVRATDEKRMAWAIGDIIENRPALSRWHPDYEDAFAAYMKG